MERKNQPHGGERRPPLFVALIPILAMMALLVIGYGIYHIVPQVLLIAAALLTGLLGMVLRFRWEDMQKGIVESIHKALPAMLIMICVGILIGSWIAAGTIPMIIYYGLKLISPKVFLVTACFVCSVTSLATGTSWGTIGTLGVAFMGIATAQGIPAGPAAGAIVAGAYFGDKMSPFSDVTNLAPAVAASNLFDHIKHMMYSAVPAWLLGFVVYFVVGLRYGTTTAESETMRLIMETLRQHFCFHVLLLLPLVVVFYFAATKKPVLPGMLFSALVAGALAVIFQGASVPEVAQAMDTGYKSATGVAEVDRLISRGGMMSMMGVQLVAFTAFSFGGIMQRTGLLQVIFDHIKSLTERVWSLVATTAASAILTAMVTGSSYLSMIVPAELLAPVYRQKGLAAKNLSRLVEECGAIIVPLIPWSMAGVYVTGTIGVSPFQYLPWAVQNYAAVLILVVFGFTGLTMAPKIREDETQVGS
ncbi:MAG: Na+/H+ antiporter NhaC [bacterium]|jgi:NhaC family Na+:H+ antiporter|nr:Na+/H+ antiporter NhaC [candidate division KSB1 bacterium]MDH7560434.1 Na+/H+ antiporter NhaC [bacterium]